MTDEQPQRNPVEQLAESFLQRYRRGERPAVSEYTQRHPELADEIRDLFPALVLLEEAGPGQSRSAGPCGQVTADGQALERLGDYRIVREIARGGMGVVYEAVQESLGRHVALKVLPFHGLNGRNYLERFEREARSAARLHHTNIVPVFAIGVHAGLHYYAMQYIQGQGLDAVLNEVRRVHGKADAGAPQPLTVSLARNLLTGQGEGPDPAGPASRAGPGEEVPLVPQDRPPKPDAASVHPDSTVVRSSPGGPSDSGLTGSSETQYFRGVARLGVQVAEALAYAHRQGIVHRDIKPSNLLLDTQGVVWITDFGLVKDEGSDNLTRTGDLVGTIRYMAPERFEDQGDARSDLYSLGATLYEALTLRPAFEDSPRARVIERVLHEEPDRPRKLDAHIPRDLETIVLKAMAKEPARRYQTAGEVAEDLRRFLADRPIRARRSSTAERTWRWCRRNPLVAGLLTSVAALLVVIAVGTSVLAWRLNREQQATLDKWRAEQAEREAREELQQSRFFEWQARLSQARAARFSRQAGRRFEGLKNLAEAARLARELNVPEERLLEMRNEAIACMALTDVRPARRLQDLSRANLGTGFEPQVAIDSRWEFYARGDPQGNVSVRRLADDQEIARFSKPGHAAAILLFSPDGRYLAAKYYRSHSEQPVEYVTWDWRHGKEVLRQACAVPTRPVIDFAFTGDSLQLIVGGRRDGSLGIYDLATGHEVRRLSLGGEAPWSIALHPDGRRLAINHHDRVTIHSLDTGAELASWKPGTLILDLAWHPDGNLLAAAGDRPIYLWDAVTRQQRRVLEGHENQVVHVAFNHAGTLLASEGWDGTTRLWDPYSGRELVTTRGQVLEFSPDDRSLAFRSADELGIWEVAHERVCRTIHGHEEEIHGVQFSPNGRLLASESPDGVRLWDADAGRQIGSLLVGRADVLFHPSGDSLLTSGYRGVYRWPLRNAAGEGDGQLRLGPAQKLHVPVSARPGPVACDQRWQRLAVVDVWQKGIVLDLQNPAGQPLFLIHDRVAYIALSSDGRWAATGTFKGADVKIWDLSQRGQPSSVHTIACGGADVKFSPDGRWLIVPDGGLRFYQVGSWELDPAMSARMHERGRPVFAADSSLLAVGSAGGKHAELIAAETGRELATLTPQDSQAFILPRAFSPDAGRLAATTSGGAMQLWDLRAVRRELAELRLDWDRPPYQPANTGAASEPLTVKVEGAVPGAVQVSGAATPRLTLNSQLVLWSLASATAPYHPEPYHHLGHIYDALGQFDRAIDNFSAALRWQPVDPARQAHLYHSRANSLAHVHREADATMDLHKVLELQPRNPQIYNNLAQIYVNGPASMRNPTKALALAQAGLTLAPDHCYCRNSLGVAQYRLGHYERAVVALERSLRDSKGERAAFQLYFLAMCYARLKDRAKAQECYNQAAAWSPDKPDLLPPDWQERLRTIRAEADKVLAANVTD
jgi:serine/threonine protein kinase/WD40 repeat protein/Flp pilus assembly protein TadD